MFSLCVSVSVCVCVVCNLYFTSYISATPLKPTQSQMCSVLLQESLSAASSPRSTAVLGSLAHLLPSNFPSLCVAHTVINGLPATEIWPCIKSLQNITLVRLCSVMSNCLWPHGLQPARLLCPWNFPGKKTREGCYFLLQGIFQIHGSNLRLLQLLHWQADSPPLCHLLASKS